MHATKHRHEFLYLPHSSARSGRLKMREWKMRYGQKGWNMQERKNQEQIAGVENAGVEKSGANRRA